jgi:P pilus assembly chaperone PapD
MLIIAEQKIFRKTLHRKAVILIAGLFTGICTLCASKAHAQVRITPMVIEAQANRNQAEGIINITNITNEPFRARVYVQPFTYNRDTGFQTLSSSPADLTPYLQFSPGELTVPPGTTRRIRLISQLPPNLPDGEYRVVIFTENLREISSTNKNGNAVNIRAKIGSTFYVRKGNLSPKLTVDNAKFDAAQNQIKLLVHNQGTASVLPRAHWALKQGNKVVSSGKTEPTGIVAQSDRNFLLNLTSTKQTKLSPGNYQLTGELIWGENSKTQSVPFSMNVTIPR